MNKTKIDYLDYTWNPISMRCTPVSDGCENCWHLGTNKRFDLHSGPPVIREKELMSPLKLKKPSIIGVQFMGDLFHEDVSFNIIDRVFATISMCPKHTFLLLTKRIERANKYYSGQSPIYGRASIAFSGLMKHENFVSGMKAYRNMENEPLQNIWIGVSCENQQTAEERIPALLQTPALKRVVSIEPMLGEIDISCFLNAWHECSYNVEKIDCVIVGCESGPKRRPCKVEWIESIVDQCKTASVPCYVKQMEIGGKVCHDINKFPKHLIIREYPK